MKPLVILCLVFTAACAKSKDSAPPTCKLEAFPEQATYPDGQVRKSNVYTCSDGCTKYTSVDNPAVQFNSCERL